MPIVKMRERGQLTIPSELRNDLGLEENDAINMVKVGDALILTQKRLAGDLLSKKIKKTMDKKGLTLDDLLKDLKSQRKGYTKKSRGRQ